MYVISNNNKLSTHMLTSIAITYEHQLIVMDVSIYMWFVFAEYYVGLVCVCACARMHICACACIHLRSNSIAAVYQGIELGTIVSMHNMHGMQRNYYRQTLTYFKCIAAELTLFLYCAANQGRLCKRHRA